MANQDIKEGFILDSYFKNNQGASLPLLWQVLYQESIRANHLLFTREEIESFDFSVPRVLTEEEKELIESIAADIFAAADLGAMKAAIARCTPEIKKYIFNLYQGFIDSLGKFLRASLN